MNKVLEEGGDDIRLVATSIGAWWQGGGYRVEIMMFFMFLSYKSFTIVDSHNWYSSLVMYFII